MESETSPHHLYAHLTSLVRPAYMHHTDGAKEWIKRSWCVYMACLDAASAAGFAMLSFLGNADSHSLLFVVGSRIG